MKYITVTSQQSPTTFYVYAEGSGLYPEGYDLLSTGNKTPGEIYYYMDGKSGSDRKSKLYTGLDEDYTLTVIPVRTIGITVNKPVVFQIMQISLFLLVMVRITG